MKYELIAQNLRIQYPLLPFEGDGLPKIKMVNYKGKLQPLWVIKVDGHDLYVTYDEVLDDYGSKIKESDIVRDIEHGEVYEVEILVEGKPQKIRLTVYLPQNEAEDPKISRKVL